MRALPGRINPLADSASRRPPGAIARRILIADDSPVNCLVAQRLLRELGYEAEFAANAAQAMERHGRQPFDLILMDSQMALDQRADITARLRAMNHVRHLPVIACITASSEEQRLACLNAGMDDVCMKPLHQAQLRTLLLVWLPPRSVEEASRRDAGTRAELQSLAELFGNGYGEVVAMFATDTEARLLAMQDAVSGDDARQLHRLAHALGCSCASMSGWRMAGLCRLLDLKFQSGHRAGCARLLADMCSEYRSFRRQLEHVLRCQQLAEPTGQSEFRSQ
ncbi:MAG: response regulator [Burkholderia sp.]|nr:response regulator [Burkholderia sp.]